MRIELKGVRKNLPLPGSGFLSVLCGVDLEIGSGQRLFISGGSGSGKSTLLGIIGGIAQPTSGSLLLDNASPRGCQSPAEISLALQEPVFIPQLTVLENLRLPLIRCRAGAATDDAEFLLEAFGLAEAFDRFPPQLSTGEKRRLNLARALIARPRLLLLDDPVEGLDAAWGERSMELVLQQVRDTRATLLVAGSCRVPECQGLVRLRLQDGKVITDDNDDC